MNKPMVVKQVKKNSIAEQLGICPGDELLCINGSAVRDCIDYEYGLAHGNMLLLLRDEEGEYEADIEKEPYEDIGITFENDGLGRGKVCANKCAFCFVDQLPKGMRKSLYVKDDDWRLSFLMGNYVTLTNLSESEIERIIEQRISPLYISIHASEAAVRQSLVRSTSTVDAWATMLRLLRHGIRAHVQLVVCAGINDGEVLTNTLADLLALYPGVQSVAAVPVGLTKYREGLYQLQPITKDNAADMIRRVHSAQQAGIQKAEKRWVYASDELYIRAQMKLPEYDAYENFPQIENGVGLVAKFMHEARLAIRDYTGQKIPRRCYDLVTAVDFHPYLAELAKELQNAFEIDLTVHRVVNDFWGHSVTVAGLLTGQDVVRQLRGALKGDAVFLPDTCFREYTDCMLDDMDIKRLSNELGIPCKIANADGYRFIEQLIVGE